MPFRVSPFSCQLGQAPAPHGPGQDKRGKQRLLDVVNDVGAEHPQIKLDQSFQPAHMCVTLPIYLIVSL